MNKYEIYFDDLLKLIRKNKPDYVEQITQVYTDNGKLVIETEERKSRS